MRVTVEIISNGSSMHAFNIEVHSAEALGATAQLLVDATGLPMASYRVVTEDRQRVFAVPGTEVAHARQRVRSQTWPVSTRTRSRIRIAGR